jgi:hypothetical protein
LGSRIAGRKIKRKVRPERKNSESKEKKKHEKKISRMKNTNDQVN